VTLFVTHHYLRDWRLRPVILVCLYREGYTSIVLCCCNLASALGRHLSNSHILAAVEFNIVLSEMEMQRLGNNGCKVYVSGTVWREMDALRIAVCDWLIPEDSEKEAGEVVAISSFANGMEANLYCSI